MSEQNRLGRARLSEIDQQELSQPGSDDARSEASGPPKERASASTATEAARRQAKQDPLQTRDR